MTCWRRLREWQEAGVWQRLHQVLLNRLGVARQLDWSRASLDAQSGAHTGRNPTDRGKPGTKRHLLVDRRGTPLAVCLSAANCHYSMAFTEVPDAVVPVYQARGRPCKRPRTLHADKGYDYRKCRLALRQRAGA